MSSKNWDVEGSRNSPNSVSNYTTSHSAICFETGTDETRRMKINPSGRELDTRIVEVETTAREFTDKLPELPTPASGDVYRGHCGDEMPVAYCDNPAHGSSEKDHIFWGSSRCRTSRCPKCWESWDFQAAKPKIAKMEALRRYRAAEGKDSKFHHVTVSAANVDLRLDSAQPRKRMTDAVKMMMQTVNVETGYILYHPWRIVDEHRDDVLGHDSGSGDMRWAADILPLIEERGWEHVREEFLVFNPHFHVVCLSEFVQGGELTREIEQRTGLVIERITREDSKVSIFGLEELSKVMMYALSHSGLYETENGDTYTAATPFGEVADFSPYPHVYDEVDEVMRETAFDVLGVDFPTRDETCSQALDIDGSETVLIESESLVESASGAGVDEMMGALWGTGGATSGDQIPDSGSETVVEKTADVTGCIECSGSIRPMRSAPETLDDEDWLEECDETSIDALRDAYDLFDRMTDSDGLPPP